MNKIKLYGTCPWQNDFSLNNYLTNYGTLRNGEWKNIEFTLDNIFDIAVIFSSPNDDRKSFSFDQSVTFLTEPPEILKGKKIHTSRVSDMYCPDIFWSTSPSDIEKIKQGNFEKPESFSSVTSEHYWLNGHRKRLEFIYYLDKAFKGRFDLYGRKYSGDFFKLIDAYRGGIENKLNGLFPYKYHFACENTFNENYFTEKILQPILCETLCFYDGCVNIQEFIDERAFVKIDLNDFEASLETIVKCISEDLYSKKIEFIKKEKKRILSDLNMLNIIWADVNGKDTLNYFKGLTYA